MCVLPRGVRRVHSSCSEWPYLCLCKIHICFEPFNICMCAILFLERVDESTVPAESGHSASLWSDWLPLRLICEATQCPTRTQGESRVLRRGREFFSFKLVFRDENIFLTISCFETRTRKLFLMVEQETMKLFLTRIPENEISGWALRQHEHSLFFKAYLKHV